MSARLATLLALLAAPGAAGAQDPGSRTTRDYLREAAGADAFERLEAQVVVAGSSDARVRAYAQRMIADHGRTAAARDRAARQSGLTPPVPGLGDDQRGLFAGLQGVGAADLDRTYAGHQALAHRFALTVAQGYARDGDDPAVRRAAQAAVPVIAAHLAAAERLARDLGER